MSVTNSKKPLKEFMEQKNTLRTYYALDEAIYKAHSQDTEESNDYAETTAQTLLENDNLPLLLRARACMILVCSVEPDFLEMAQEAVRIAELAQSRCEEPGEFEDGVVRACKTVLSEAQAAYDEHVKDSERDPEAKNKQATAAVATQEAKAEDEGNKATASKSRRQITDKQKITKTHLDSPPRLERPRRTIPQPDELREQDDDEDAEMDVGSTGGVERGGGEDDDMSTSDIVLSVKT